MIKSFRYFGSQNQILPWVLDNLPKHQKFYELFGGSGLVTLNKPRGFDAYNDLYSPSVNFFRAMQSNPEKVIDWVTAILENDDLKEIAKTNPIAFNGSLFSHEDAAKFWIHSQISFRGSGSRWSTGFDKHKSVDLEPLSEIAKAIQGVQILNQNGFELLTKIPKDPEILIYANPPYYKTSRKSKDRRTANPFGSLPRRQYFYEFTPWDHLKMCEMLQGRSAVISGYPSRVYDHALVGWECLRWNPEKSLECLWISPEDQKRLF